MRPTVGVVCCAYTTDRWADLTAAHAALARQTVAPDEVVVVIDHDDELLALARRGLPGAVVVPSTGPRGLSGARNTGVAASGADVLLFLDDDAVPEPDWVERMLAPFDDPAVAGVGGWSQPAWVGRRPGWFPDCFGWVVGCSYRGLPGAGAALRNPIGSAMGFRREALELVGGFRSDIGRVGGHPVGCEETELSIRLRQARPQARIVHAPDAVVRHRVPPERGRPRYFARRCYWEGWSKAVVAGSVGSRDALSSERAYTTRVLPAAALGGLLRALRGRPTGLGETAAVAIGLAVTAFGYLRGMLALRREPARRRPAGGAAPVRPASGGPAGADFPVQVLLVDVDAAGGLPAVDPHRPDGGRWAAAWLYLRHRGQVRGTVELDLSAGRALTPAEVAAEVARQAPHVLAAGPGATGPDGREWPTRAQLPGISVVVPTVVQRPAELRRCLAALQAQDYPEHEVVLVDNRPAVPDPDPLPEALAGLGGVRVVRAPVPGISHARNAGTAAARYPIVAFTDDDVEADPGWLRALGARFVRNPDADAVTGLILPARLDAVAQLWFERHYGGFGSARSFEPLDYRAVAAADGSRRRRRTVEAVDATGRATRRFSLYGAGVCGAGANLAFRRDALERQGGFDPALGTGTPSRGGEDLAAVIRVLWSGGTVAFEPRALVRHDHRATVPGLGHQLAGYGTGFTAMLTSLVLEDPRHLGGVLAGVPRFLAGASRRRRPVTDPGAGVPDAAPPLGPPVPAWLGRRERLGYLRGPWAYLVATTRPARVPPRDRHPRRDLRAVP